MPRRRQWLPWTAGEGSRVRPHGRLYHESGVRDITIGFDRTEVIGGSCPVTGDPRYQIGELVLPDKGIGASDVRIVTRQPRYQRVSKALHECCAQLSHWVANPWGRWASIGAHGRLTVLGRVEGKFPGLALAPGGILGFCPNLCAQAPARGHG